MATDHAAKVREFIRQAVWPMGDWQRDVEASLDALVAERDEAYRTRAAAEKERDSLRVQWWDAMCEKDEQRKMRRAAEIEVARVANHRDLAEAAEESLKAMLAATIARAEAAEAALVEARQERDFQQGRAVGWEQRAVAAEAERDALAAALRDGVDCVEAYHGDPEPSEECAVCIWLRRAAALARVSPSTQRNPTE